MPNIKDYRRLVMAILNITPDSFFAGSRIMVDSDIFKRVQGLIAQGADVIDVGGYSTRPSAEDVATDEEFRRVDLAFEVIKKIAPDMMVSVDTFRSEIVERIYGKWGAFTVNDVTAGQADMRMIPMVGRLGLPYIAMHSRGTPQTMQSMTKYDDVTRDVIYFFEQKIEECHSAGIKDLTLDPGFGFAKTIEQNFELLANLSHLCDLGYTVLAGVSRKSMIWRTLETTPDESLYGTVALNWEALRQGASLLRVHDVRAAKDTIRLFEEFEKSHTG